MLWGSVAKGSSLKYGCLRACRAVVRLSGSYVRRPFNRLKPVLLSFGNFCSAGCKTVFETANDALRRTASLMAQHMIHQFFCTEESFGGLLELLEKTPV